MEITINGIKYKPGKPKAKIWRELSQFEDERALIKTNDFADAHAEMIAKVFSNPEVTEEKILEEYAVEDLMPLYKELVTWFYGLIHSKMGKIPNEETATGA